MEPTQRRLRQILDGYVAARRGEPFGRVNPLWNAFRDVVTFLGDSPSVVDNKRIALKWSACQGRWETIPWIAGRKPKAARSSSSSSGNSAIRHTVSPEANALVSAWPSSEAPGITEPGTIGPTQVTETAKKMAETAFPRPMRFVVNTIECCCWSLQQPP